MVSSLFYCWYVLEFLESLFAHPQGSFSSIYTLRHNGSWEPFVRPFPDGWLDSPTKSGKIPRLSHE